MDAPPATKVATVTFAFWVMKICATTLGETAGDLLSMSDFMDRTLALGYLRGSLILITLLIAVLALWRFVVGSRAVDHIRSFKVELFYWTAILVSNTLGTALGDFLADSSGLGFAGGALLIPSIIALIVLAYFLTTISRTVLFWFAFVLTRPLGATMGDLLTKTHEKGGLGFGTIGSSGVLACLLVVCIGATYYGLGRRPKPSA
jgi:uncharacterized membrane-anchored protein